MQCNEKKEVYLLNDLIRKIRLRKYKMNELKNGKEVCMKKMNIK